MTTAAPVKERPILFSGPMVRAILDGRKSQTRRIVNDRKAGGVLMMRLDRDDCEWEEHDGASQREHGMCFRWVGGNGTYIHCPYGYPGDRLWVRETWRVARINHSIQRAQFYTAQFRNFAVLPHPQPDQKLFAPLADKEDWSYRDTGCAFGKWRPSIHMPRWASRLTLEITGVRVERVQEISAKDIIAEGAVTGPHDSQFGRNPISAFDGGVYMDLKSLWAAGWEKINGKGAWERNDWVWVIEFKRLEQPS